MGEKELEVAIRMMVAYANLYSCTAEKVKKKNLTLIEQDYFSRILGIEKALYCLEYKLEEDGIRADGESEESIEYMHYKVSNR